MDIKASLRDIIPYSPGKTFPGKTKLASNENPLGPSPKAIQAIQEVLPNIYRYPDGASLDLRSKIAQHQHCRVEEVAVGNGSDEIFALVCGAFIDTGDQGIISENTFSEYRFSLKLFGATVKALPLDQGKYDLNAMAKAVDQNTKMIFLCNPNNPTGTYRSHNEIREFLDKIPSRIVVVLDEAYQDYVEAEDYPDSKELIKDYPNLLVTRTFSKIYGLAGMRIGYALGQAPLIRSVLTAKQAFNVNLLSQKAGCAALDDLDFHRKSREMNSHGKVFLYEELDKLEIPYYPTESNFICLRFNGSSDEIFQEILDRGIIIRSLKSFGLPFSIRYTISSQEDNQRFIDILKELKEKELC